MQVAIVVKVTIPIDVENVNDSIVVIIDVFPVENAITIPIIELGERCTACLTSWIRIDWVRICCCRTVPCNNIGCLVERETVIFVVDVVIIKIVFEIGCIPTYENISKIVWTGGTAEFWVQPIIDAVVILVEWPHTVIVKVLVIIDFTIKSCLAVCIATRCLVRCVVLTSVISEAVTIVVDVNTGVRNTVIVVVRVEHVENSVVIIICIG